MITEDGSLIHCCWRHNASIISLDNLRAEIRNSVDCSFFLESVEFLPAERCPNVRYNQLTLPDLPPLTSSIHNSSCESLSENVKAISIEDRARCIWFPGHFDLGVRHNHDEFSGMAGMMHRRLCEKFQQDCKVSHWEINLNIDFTIICYVKCISSIYIRLKI